MQRTLPKRLKKEPLLEALWEIRFSSSSDSVVDVLPGLLYKEKAWSTTKIIPLPASNFPRPVLKQDPEFRYVPTVKLEGQPYSIQVGEHVVSLSCPRPYTGWQAFGGKIRELSQVLRSTNLLTTPERFSLKYIDIVPSENLPDTSPLTVNLKLGDMDLTKRPVHLRTELREDEFLHIVQIASPTKATHASGETLRGVLLDIDTIRITRGGDFWQDFDGNLDKAHDLGKRMFFRLLTEETEESLEPEY